MLRTDLALEAREIAEGAGKIDGVESEESKFNNVTVTKVRVINDNGSKALGKPVGTYITIEAQGLDNAEDDAFQSAIEAVSHELEEMLKPFGNGVVLVAGLGNAMMTPDALGPRCVKNLLVTRHISGELAKITGIGNLRGVAAIAPGVLGQTGVEVVDIVKAIVSKIIPVAVIIVDALASRRASRVGNTVQITDAGIIPGSGIGNNRVPINKETLGVPVISIGVPTVIDAATLTLDVLEAAGIKAQDQEEEKIRAAVESGGITLYVTPKMIDVVVEHAAKLTGYAINKALNPEISLEDMMRMVS